MRGKIILSTVGIVALVFVLLTFRNAYRSSINADKIKNNCECTCLPYQVRHCKKDTVVCYAPDGGVELIEIETTDQH